MHMTIRAIIYAKTYEEAIDNAKEVFDGLSRPEGKEFDYYGIYEEETTRADTKEGCDLIAKGMESTRSALYDNLARVRDGLSRLSDEDIWMMTPNPPGLKEPPLYLGTDMLRHFMGEAGQYKGSGIFIYDDDGEGIRDPKHLHRALTKWASLYEDCGKPNPYAGMDVWVVPSDVHF